MVWLHLVQGPSFYSIIQTEYSTYIIQQLDIIHKQIKSEHSLVSQVYININLTKIEQTQYMLQREVNVQYNQTVLKHTNSCKKYVIILSKIKRKN